MLEPKVPDHFQDRDLEVNRALALIAEKKWCGLYGLTGTGKTSTAARIARHVRLKERNRVVWLTLGAQADISIVLEGLANAVGNSLRMLPDAERKVARLRAITCGLGRLIVFDDVRSSDQLYGVLSGVGDGNSVLITSQQEYSVPAIKFGIISIPLDALSSNDGACVLLKLLRIPDAADRLREWETLAAALGNHPLALEVAAGDIQLGDFKSPLQYIEDRISTGKWARGEPTLQRLQKTVLDGLKQAGTAHPAKFKTLAAFEGRAVSKFAIKNVCRLPSEEATDTFVRDLLLRGILRRRSVNVFALHPFILHIASLANTQRERSLLVDAQRRHVNHYCNLLKELGGYEWNLSKYPEIVPEEFEVFHAIDAAARIADHDQDDALRDLCIGMTTLISWYLHWRGYWDLRVRFCKRVTDMAEQAGSQASFEGREIQIGNLYVDRGWVHLEQGDIESAEICAVNGEKWLFGSGDQIFARELQAQVLHQMGHFGQAVAIFESLAQAVSVARRPWFVFSYRLADSLFALGDTKRSSLVLQDLICKLKQPQLVHNEIIEDVKGRIQYRAALRHISIGDEASAFALLEEAVRNFASSEIVASERAAASIEFATLLANRHLYEDSRQTLEDAGRLARRAGDFALVSLSESLLRTLPMKVE